MTMNTPKPNKAISKAGSNRRAFHRALLETSGCLSDGIRKLDCTVLDLSLGGAMVTMNTGRFGETGTSEDMGEELILTLEIEAPVLLSAEIVWRRGLVLGLKFFQEPDEVANGLGHLLPPECFKVLVERDIPQPLG